MAAAVLSGCARLCPFDLEREGLPSFEAAGQHRGWWYVRFKMDWPEDSDVPSWFMDVLLAHKVVAPVLDRHRSDIVLWRFHRRAVRDAGGHQFSFIFYSTWKTAKEVYSDVRGGLLLGALKTSGRIARVLYDDTASIPRPHIEDTSDSRWSPPVQKSWPLFIMGVSEMWLGLISEVARDKPDGEDGGSLDAILEYYRSVNERVEAIWRKECGHALLHHLNAIFGYEPLMVGEGTPMRF